MRQFLTFAAVATAAFTVMTSSVFASTPRPRIVQAAVGADHDVCRNALRSAACGSYQKQLLNTVGDDARTGDAQQVATRQLDALIASVR